MTTTTVSEQTGEQLYEELRRELEGMGDGEQRQKVLKRMTRQIKFAKWREERLRKFKTIRPATIWILLATGALTPILLFSVFIWVSLWVE